MIRTKRRLSILTASVALATLTICTIRAAAQQPAQSPAFHAAHYEVNATLNPAKQMLSATVQADFVADQASNTLQVELNPNLKITSIHLKSGLALQFSRLADSPLDVIVSLPNTVTQGQTVSVNFAYSGPLANADSSPSPNVQLAYIGKKNAYLLLSARWFPLISYAGQRYTAVFNLTVPANFAVVGSGASGAPSSVSPPAEPATTNSTSGQGMGEGQGQWLRYTFTSNQPGPVGTFVAGALELTPVNEAGIPISVYTLPADKATASAYAAQFAKIMTFYSSEFGPLPNQNFTIAQLPTVAPMDGVSAPGMLLVNLRQWAKQPNEQLLSRLVALQWWNNLVMPASASDVWLSSGLAQYSEVLYQENVHGDSGLKQAVNECAVGALMDNSAAPIANAWMLQPYTTAYNSVVRDKGAMVFHMLRSSMGKKPFLSVLQEYLQKYSGKTASISDFENLVQTKLTSMSGPSEAETSQAPPLNATAFFSQWLNSTGIPKFQMQYTVYRTQKGFKVVGNITQNLTTLNMPIQVRVETEGNPVTKTVEVVGDSSQFSVDTFGQPKPNGITLDPNNNVLKDTSSLRLQALIAHGVALAEQGQFYQAIQQYQKALDIQRQNGLALFRMGEAYFYEKNYQAAANSFRDALDGQIQPSSKWVEVWSHIYLGKIYDLIGQRQRAINEYQKALDTKDNTAGALDQAREYMKKPYAVSKPAPTPSS